MAAPMDPLASHDLISSQGVDAREGGVLGGRRSLNGADADGPRVVGEGQEDTDGSRGDNNGNAGARRWTAVEAD